MADLITDPPPTDVREEQVGLAAALERVIPPKRRRRNLLIGTWNVRGLDRATAKWRTEKGDSPIRDLSNVLCLAEVIRRFDLVAIQEVRQSAQAFLAILQILGKDWGFLVTDVTRGKAGNYERLAFVFDRKRVQPSGLACELVVAAEEVGIGETVLKRQFARTPYAASFTFGDVPFTLITLHVVWGQRPADRLPELEEIALWLARWARGKDPWGTNLIALGDFNIDRKADPLYRAFTSTGLEPPDPLNHVPRTVFDDPDPEASPNHRNFYDQIAWFKGAGGVPALSFDYENAGMFNFADGLIRADTTHQLSWRISDHFPLWVEFDMRPSS